MDEGDFSRIKSFVVSESLAEIARKLRRSFIPLAKGGVLGGSTKRPFSPIAWRLFLGLLHDSGFKASLS